MGKYKVSFNEKTQSIIMDLSGDFSDEDAISFVNDFIKMSKQVKTSDTYLILDCGKLFLYPCDVKIKLEAVFGLYKQTGYKLIKMRLFKPQKELGRKLKELAKLVNLKLELEFVDKSISDNGENIKFE
jgi:hypothetical protein